MVRAPSRDLFRSRHAAAQRKSEPQKAAVPRIPLPEPDGIQPQLPGEINGKCQP